MAKKSIIERELKRQKLVEKNKKKREEILNELSTHYNTNRDAIKNLFIALLNSGSFKMRH